MPTGKVKWYDAEKGFGFISGDEGTDVFLHAQALPAGTTTLKGGTRVEYGIVKGRRGAQALSVRVLDAPQSVEANRRVRDRKPADEMVVIVEDLIRLLDDVGCRIDPPHAARRDPAREVERDRAGAGAHVEHRHAGPQLGQEVGGRVLGRPPAVGAWRCGRSARWWRGTHAMRGVRHEIRRLRRVRSADRRRRCPAVRD